MLGLKAPVPPVHIPVDDPPVIEPFKVTSGLLAQTDWFTPALTIGAGVMVIVILSLTGLQFPLPVVVSVKVTVPAVISAAEGV